MIGIRLKEERERLALTQEAWGAIASAARRTVSDWEKGVSSPNTVQLSALSDIGLDVLYVVTGARSAVLQGLTPEETALLDNFRHSPPAARQALKTTSDLFAKHDCPGDAAESA